MSRYNFFAHETVASSYFPVGSESWDRMALSGYDYNTFMAENLIAGYETAEEAFEGWRTSPGHKANMLDDAEKVIGIVRVYVPGSEYGWYWTTNFGGEVDTTSHAPGETPSSEKKETEKSGKAQSRNTDREGIENGSMNGEDVWGQKTKREGNNLIGKDVARLGGYDNAEDEISQEIRMQKGQRLFYRVWIKTEEKEHPADGLVVRLMDGTGKHLVTLDSHTDTDAEKVSRDGWIWDSVNLSRFAGETVTLNFLAKTDEERPTTFYVDDVALK